MKNNQPARIAGFLVFILFAVLVNGCTLGESDAAYCNYYVSITGLDNSSGYYITEIMIPLPMVNGEPMYGGLKLNNSYPKDIGSNAWSAEIVDTDHGKMISFKTNEKNLTNIKFKISRLLSNYSGPSLGERKKLVATILDYPLSPRSNDTAAGYTEWINGSYVKNYTSYVYIDKGILPTGNNTIKFDPELSISEGAVSGIHGSYYNIYLHENIPQDVTGWIPVTVQIQQ